MSAGEIVADVAAVPRRDGTARRTAAFLAAHPVIAIGGAVLALFVVIALVAPLVLPDPARLNPLQRLRTPGLDHLFGTDQFGRSTLSRTLNGTRISLTVGILVAAVTTAVGLLFGLIAGFLRRIDNLVMRLMDGIMAIPGILLAIALMSLFGSSIRNVVIAISIAEIPRMARVVRSSVLVIREQPYVEAAVTNGTPLSRLLWRHVLPNVAAPVIVQATYVFASAMIVESVLSFLGAGTPPTIPSWGNMLAEGRQYLQRAPWMIAFPGVALALLVLTVNVLGDGLRDALDPRLSRRARR
ncbi:ABC transporter permease [Bradyrhizobium sp. U87765 SZCCT0131]|uniref:ABC transporter permease n=1 Tax=unclassified Bradyrhizobium TaxID=2631580 RepID=UPI001BAD2972|nr:MULTISPECIES: ABC transporter permease [unclassified Bradyrhizobium]MBR1221955.1 ABC transporter permease [Bradyrhizobium sp. U87765 SZCCT0131]MBR1263847.1 ABC transporter permease [Bradyrhizobium sp. U87765 SZCCT0134]MBR1302583.1 ABC transporter permease [Bradyrhizobium sp. U87765 SZCCT0110]MBR1320097.1 ABC transporter permease [Bradyrhizobium sp. U87765 SZCCT0109]MBR1348790.1 ABC transporter permease [Bradyrhizobium sp. U87765 SZCCT0048]